MSMCNYPLPFGLGMNACLDIPVWHLSPLERFARSSCDDSDQSWFLPLADHDQYHAHVPDHLMTTSETTYLSIKEAAERYSKAEITVRRLVRTIVNDLKHDDRHLITPNSQEAQKLKSKRRPFSYSVSAELLEKHFGATAQAPRAVKLSHGPDYIRLLEKTNETLQEQVRVKDDQIRSLHGSIEGLSERQREMNILMKGLQQQVLLGTSQKSEEQPEKSDDDGPWWKLW